MQELFDELLRVVGALCAWASTLEQSGYEIDGAAELQDASEALQRLQQQIFEHWPWIDNERIAEGRAEISRGEFRTPQEILNELQGSDSQACGT